MGCASSAPYGRCGKYSCTKACPKCCGLGPCCKALPKSPPPTPKPTPPPSPVPTPPPEPDPELDPYPDNPDSLEDSYILENPAFAEGKYGPVYKATHKETGDRWAIKAVSKQRMRPRTDFFEEVDIFTKMDHKNVIKYKESFADESFYYLVMELADGEELFERIIGVGVTEVQAAFLMNQIFAAVQYMHGEGYCHRDIKPENLVFSKRYAKEEPIETCLLKLIDLSKAAKFTEGQLMVDRVGTTFYASPQVLFSKYDNSADMWSCGVIMYTLLCGYPPFNGDTDLEVERKVKRGDYRFPSEDWKDISDGAKELIKNLLNLNSNERWTVNQALEHPWIQTKAVDQDNANVLLPLDYIDKLRTFRTLEKLRKAAVMILSNQLTTEQLEAMQILFAEIDTDKDGKITLEELKQVIIEKSGVDEIPKDLSEILDILVKDGDLLVDFQRFVTEALERKERVRTLYCKQAFRVFDTNGDDKIAPDELRSILGDGTIAEILGKDTIASFLAELDQNDDGAINFTEFVRMMEHKDFAS